jgi:hypothetical protein
MSYAPICCDLGDTAIMDERWIALITFGLIFVAINARAQTGENVHVRSGLNHNEYDHLLKKYVNELGLVNYGAWKQNAADLSALDAYLHQFAAKADNAAPGTLTTHSCCAGFCLIIPQKASGN